MPKVPLRGSLTFKFQFRRSPALRRRSLGETRTTGGSNGSIARGLGTESTSFAIVWPMRMARIEHAWSTGFRRYIINASSAAGAEVRRVFEANFDRRACHHVALLTPEALLTVGRRLSAKVLDLKGRFRCRGCGRKERAVVSVKWRGRGV